MRILFIYTREFPQSPVKPLVDFEAIQFGISHISSNLKFYGHQTRLLVMTRKSTFSEIDRFIHAFAPQLVCCTAVASEYIFVAKIAGYIKKRYPDKFLLIGGVHATLQPDSVMSDAFDACCIGEGEAATLELATQMDQGRHPSKIPNLWIKHGNDIEKNPSRCFTPDLDVLPNADREMWMEWIDLDASHQRPSVLLGRGCPFLCAYCCNHALKKVADGSYVRFRSHEKIISELRELSKLLPEMKEVYFEVETFAANIAWSIDFCRKLQIFNASLPQPLSFGVNIRVTNRMKKINELFIAMKDSNFKFVNIGLESGSEQIRSEVLSRYYSNQDVIEAVNAARNNNLEVTFYNLIGLPSETIAEYKETIALNRLCLPEKQYLSIFYPYPGTDLYNVCQEQGLLPDNLLYHGMERKTAVVSYKHFNSGQIQKAYRWFNYYVYKDIKSDDEVFDVVIGRYLDTSKGSRSVMWLFLLVCDLILPSRKFFPQYPEHMIFRRILRVSWNKLFNKS